MKTSVSFNMKISFNLTSVTKILELILLTTMLLSHVFLQYNCYVRPCPGFAISCTFLRNCVISLYTAML